MARQPAIDGTKEDNRMTVEGEGAGVTMACDQDADERKAPPMKNPCEKFGHGPLFSEGRQIDPRVCRFCHMEY